MEPAWLELLAYLVVSVALTVAPFWLLDHGDQVAERMAELARRLRGPEPEGAPVRPIEQVARDVRRLRVRYRCPPDGVSFAKYSALRRAYDQALAEGCSALGVVHLLCVLEPGEELDGERDRVEALLLDAGMSLDYRQ